MKHKTLKEKRNILPIIMLFTLVFVLLIVFSAITSHTIFEKKVIRESAIAGSWYPGDKTSIENTLDGYLRNVEKTELNDIKAIIVPHAGWQYSGQIAATAFKQLEDKEYKTVILIGPSHTADFKGASIPDVTHYETPLGLVKISDKTNKILEEELFQNHKTAHIREHCLEVELPFLQKVLGDFELIPILIGSLTSEEELKKIAESLKKYIDDKTLIVVSSDFTHYGVNYNYMPFNENIPENLEKLDLGAIEQILEIDANGFNEYCSQTKATICGRNPIIILLHILDEHAKARLLYYDTSGRMAGDYTSSVSYATIIFTNEEQEQLLTKQEQDFLLRLARQTLEQYLKTGEKPEIDQSKLTPDLKKIQGCFTTLTNNQGLRGCIGQIQPQEELYKCIVDNAINAALYDLRTPSVTYNELEDIKIEISVLSVPEKIEFKSGEDLKQRLRPEIDGVVLKSGSKSSTYLPQVWEQIPDKNEFLSQLCLKGNMPQDCYQDTETDVYIYQAFIFSE